MSKETAKKLTLEDLIARKAQRDEAKMSFKAVYLEKLGGELTIKKLPLMEMLRLMEGAGDDATLQESLEFEIELIYKCCPLFQDKRLQAEYDCAEPTDVVCRVLDDDIGAVAELAAAIMDFYGMGESIRQQLKN